MVPSTTKYGLRDLILAICPPWLTRGTLPGNPGIAGRLMYGFGLLGDSVLEKLSQGVYARMPGRGTPTANPLLGNDRVLSQAPGEPSGSFAQRLQGAFDAWATAGSDAAVLRQILIYFTPYLPLTRVVSNSGVWSWYEANTSNFQDVPPVHYQVNSWDWDDVESAAIPGQPAWWRDWLLVFPGLSIVGTVAAASNFDPIEITSTAPTTLVTGDQVCITGVAGNLTANGYAIVTVIDSTHFTLNGIAASGAFAASSGTIYRVPTTTLQATLAGASGPGGPVVGPGIVCGAINRATGSPYVCGEVPQFSCGFNVPSSWFQPLAVQVDPWKAAESWFRYFVFSFDPTVFSPYSTPGTEPAGGVSGPGTWDGWTVEVGGIAVPNKNPNARYVGGVS